ncbi:MAG: GFA family protein [Gaiellaceae bacterium]
MENAIRTGGCLCGDVRYRVRGEPVHVGRCHCADCRKESGSAFTVYGQWPIDAFELTGDIASYHGRGFCPRCGSRLLDPPDAEDTLVEIRIGSLDDAPSGLKPEAEVWVKRREPWLAPVDGASQHDENRPRPGTS